MDFGITALVQNAGRHFEAKQEAELAEEIANRNRSEEWGHNYILDAVNDAQAAGIHPLFALGGAQGGGGGSVTVGGGGDMADMSGLRDSLGKLFSQEKEELALAKTAAEIEALKSGAGRDDATAAQINQSTIARAVQSAHSTGPAKNPDEITPTMRDPAKMPAYRSKDGTQYDQFKTPFGFTMYGNRDVTNAGGPMQDRYGEPGEWAFGAGTMVRDLGSTINVNYEKFLDKVTEGGEDANWYSK